MQVDYSIAEYIIDNKDLFNDYLHAWLDRWRGITSAMETRISVYWGPVEVVRTVYSIDGVFFEIDNLLMALNPSR